MIDSVASALTTMVSKHVVSKMNPKAITASQMFGKLDPSTGQTAFLHPVAANPIGFCGFATAFPTENLPMVCTSNGCRTSFCWSQETGLMVCLRSFGDVRQSLGTKLTGSF